MLRRAFVIFTIAFLFGAVYFTAAETLDQEAALVEPAAASAPSADLERGRYLVENVAMCGQCHTPRNARGALRTDRWLDGAPIPVATPRGHQAWALVAPRIAGLGTFTDEEFVRLMTTGVNRDGRFLRAPMPPFRMTSEDAWAIAAYLRSLP